MRRRNNIKNEIRTVMSEGKSISYFLTRKRVKNINMRVKGDGSINVSAGIFVPVYAIDDFVVSRSEFVFRTLDRIAQSKEQKDPPLQYENGEVFLILGKEYNIEIIQDMNECVTVSGRRICIFVKKPEDYKRKEKIFKKFTDDWCRNIFQSVLDKLYPFYKEYGIDYPILKIRRMKSCWGSCLTHKGIITINTRLIEFPLECVEYVIAHELCHLKHPDHSIRFYDFLGHFLYDWRERRKLLRQWEKKVRPY